MTNEEAKTVLAGDNLYLCSRYADGTFNISIAIVREVKINAHVKGRQKPVELMCVAENFVSDKFKDNETVERLDHENWCKTATGAVRDALADLFHEKEKAVTAEEKLLSSIFGKTAPRVELAALADTIHDLVGIHRCLKEAISIDDEKIQDIKLEE